MRLFLAEKPSLARAIAEALPGPHKRAAHHITCGEGNVVAWCAGHILENAPPEDYAEHFRFWRLEHLPITPREWKYTERAPELLRAIAALLKKASRVVHAGDPDREGQLLVDEVLQYLGYRGPVDRLLVRDLRPEALSRALGALEPNSKYRDLSESALARQRADWLYGINLTRLYTVLASDYRGVLSVGRVQTPVLGMVVARDRAIAEFRPTVHYGIRAEVRAAAAAGAEPFVATWSPGAKVSAFLDSDNRLLRREVAEEVARRVVGQLGSVVSSSQDRKREAPPLPYSLATLQVDAGKRLGLSAKAVLDAVQTLYEGRLVTYPRSDCSHLPVGHHAQAPAVRAAALHHVPALGPLAVQADLSLRTKAWNDKKVTAHHAIIPTPLEPGAPPAALPEVLRGVYELVSRRYLAQFFPPHEYFQTRFELDVAEERFVASGRQELKSGWRVALAGAPGSLAAERDAPYGPAVPVGEPLPALLAGDPVTLSKAAVTDHKTEAPKAFDDASLISAMCRAGEAVADPQHKKLLADGIGTPATRADILETLLERKYVERAGHALVSTATGRALIGCLPAEVTSPETTALMEAALRLVADGRVTAGEFLAQLGEELSELIHQGRAHGRIAVPSAGGGRSAARPAPRRAPKPRSPSRRRSPELER